MKIGILGTRGIPNHYGGFEQFAEFLSLGLVEKGHEVAVYNSSNHPYQESYWKGVKIIHCKDAENRVGTVGQFVYDLNCILNSRKQDFDILLQLGYTSSSVWKSLLPKQSMVVTNMDGLEWKRTKFSKAVQQFLKRAEAWAVKSSDFLVSDSKAIQSYLKDKYAVDSTFIAYGSEIFDEPDSAILEKYDLRPKNYFMLIARMEPENNVETILDGFNSSKEDKPFLVIGNVTNEFGKYLQAKFANNPLIRFVSGIYDINILNNLRYYSKLYFHGHSVGGTNPSLLEAMASSAPIVAHGNEFNRAVLKNDAIYFDSKDEVRTCIENPAGLTDQMIANNLERIKEEYSWQKIINDYEALFLQIMKQ